MLAALGAKNMGIENMKRANGRTQGKMKPEGKTGKILGAAQDVLAMSGSQTGAYRDD